MYFQESKPKKHGKDRKHRHRKDSEGKKVSKLWAFLPQSIQSGRPASYLDFYTRRGTWEGYKLTQRTMGRVRQKKNEAASPFFASPKVLCAPRRFDLQACRRFSEGLYNVPGCRSPHYIGIEDILANTPCCSPFRDVQMSWEIFQCISFLELLSQCSVQFVAKKNTKVLLEFTTQRSGDIFWETEANVAIESHRNRWQQNRIVTTCNNVFYWINRITSIFTRVHQQCFVAVKMT